MVDFNYHKSIEDQSRKVLRETDPVSLFGLASYLFMGLLLALVLLVYCWEHQKTIKYGYEIEKLKKEKESLAEVYQKLTLERASLLAPHRVSEYARQNLGLTYPSNQHVIVRSIEGGLDEDQQETLMAFNQVSSR